MDASSVHPEVDFSKRLPRDVAGHTDHGEQARLIEHDDARGEHDLILAWRQEQLRGCTPEYGCQSQPFFEIHPALSFALDLGDCHLLPTEPKSRHLPSHIGLREPAVFSELAEVPGDGL